jgi:hypothetical protein
MNSFDMAGMVDPRSDVQRKGHIQVMTLSVTEKQNAPAAKWLPGRSGGPEGVEAAGTERLRDTHSRRSRGGNARGGRRTILVAA